MSTTLSVIVNGTPVAVPADEPKLDRMSLRTTPFSASTFGPFEPSPGNGPAVSSGISAHASPPDVEPGAASDVADAVDVEPDVEAVLVLASPLSAVDDAGLPVSSSVEQATSTAAPAPASILSVVRLANTELRRPPPAPATGRDSARSSR